MTADDRRALAAGLPGDVLLILIGARRLWHQGNGGEAGPDPAGLTAPMPAGWWHTPELAAAVTHPAAAVWDAVFVAAMRRRIG